jgi:hypothetical protein
MDPSKGFDAATIHAATAVGRVGIHLSDAARRFDELRVNCDAGPGLPPREQERMPPSKPPTRTTTATLSTLPPVTARAAACALATVLLAVVTAFGSGAARAGDVAVAPIPTVSIDAAPARAWRITWRFAIPVSELVFARSPDNSRVQTWAAPDDFELVRAGDRERLRRRDGAAFAAATLEVPAAYRELPKDYAPFAPFGDGGRLVHTGRLYACGGECPDDARWQFELRFAGWRHAWVDGKVRASPAAWTDGGDGRYVYVGDTRVLETPRLAAVLDRALPDSIRTQLLAELPAFMTFFDERLGAAPEALAVFVSYDTSPQRGWGRQGGVLPGQVSVHFYGEPWPREMAKAGFAADLAWHLAHEAAHVYQRQLYAERDEDAWIHEGSAEAFAALALRAVAPAAGTYVAGRVGGAADACRRKIGARSVRAAIAAGDFEASYDCGLAIALAIDAKVRAARPGVDGLYAVWRDYLAHAGGAPAADRVALFLDAVARGGGPELAAWVRHAAGDPAPLLGAAESSTVSPPLPGARPAGISRRSR